MNTDNHLSEPCGALLLYKPQGMTSHDAVAQIRKIYHTKAVGHTGTLDPLATGLLVILLGRATKAEEYLAVHDKEYIASMKLGMTTDTQDITGQVLSTCDTLPSFHVLLDVCNTFIGPGMQTPPMYSAIKVQGNKLVDLARKGITVDRQQRPIAISKLIVSPTETASVVSMDVVCSGGTYIRTLCHDIGQLLGCGAVMSDLKRISVGSFSLNDAYTLDCLSQMTEGERLSCLLPVSSLFSHLSSVHVPAFFADLLRNGCTILQSKLHCELKAETLCTLWRETPEGWHFFALGKSVGTPDGPGIKADKIFVL